MSQKRHFTPADEPFFLVRTLAAAYPKGFALKPHVHAWGQFIYAISGVMSIATAQGSWVAPPGWAVWVPADVSHSIRFCSGTALRTLYLRPSFDATLPASSAVIAVSPLLAALIARSMELRFLDAREPVHTAMATLIAQEIAAPPPDSPSLELPLPQSKHLRRVADHLLRSPHHAATTGNSAIARRFGIGLRSLERGFAGETGMPLGQWRRKARLLDALRELGEGAAIKQAADHAGYRSPSAFVAAFRAAFGTTPGRWTTNPPPHTAGMR